MTLMEEIELVFLNEEPFEFVGKLQPGNFGAYFQPGAPTNAHSR